MNLFNGFPNIEFKKYIRIFLILSILFSIPNIQKEIYKLKKEYRKEELKKIGIYL